MASHFWLDFFVFVFFWAGVAAFILGLLIVVSPATVMRVGQVLNRWVSTDQLFHDLDSPHTTEKLFYRHHRAFGVLLVLGGGYILYIFAYQLGSTTLAGSVTLFGSHTVAQWLLDSLIALNRMFAAVAIALGITVFFRPSALKDLELSTNRWFAVDESLKALDAQMGAPERFFARNPRLFGVLIMLGSLYVVFNLRVFFAHG